MGITFGAIDEHGMPLPHDEDRHEPNCAAGNQRLVLATLGFVPAADGDEYGVCTAGDLYARCLLALALIDDAAAVPGHTDPKQHNFHYCGRRAGYLVDKLHELREHAEWCAAHDLRVQWT
jgi:hypothetical protein